VEEIIPKKFQNNIINYLVNSTNNNSSLFNEFVRKLGLLPKKTQFTHERVEYNVFLFDEPLKGSKSLKIFKISLTFRFDKL
jgi:hypothetical protein